MLEKVEKYVRNISLNEQDEDVRGKGGRTAGWCDVQTVGKGRREGGRQPGLDPGPGRSAQHNHGR